jgi:DNA polymerase-3 subunit alpha/DNA polymerase-3 subunit epsilon
MFLFVDTETTGLSPTSRIVSVSWAVFDGSQTQISCQHHLVQPIGFTIPASATRVHGITTDRAQRTGLPLQTVLQALNADINSCKPSLCVGHNISFDLPILLNEYRNAQVEDRLSVLPSYCTMRNSVHICRLPRRHGGAYKNPSLSELHKHLFGVPHLGAHDALADVLACVRCFFRLRTANTRSAATYTSPAPRIRATPQQSSAPASASPGSNAICSPAGLPRTAPLSPFWRRLLNRSNP